MPAIERYRVFMFGMHPNRLKQHLVSCKHVTYGNLHHDMCDSLVRVCVKIVQVAFHSLCHVHLLGLDTLATKQWVASCGASLPVLRAVVDTCVATSLPGLRVVVDTCVAMVSYDAWHQS